MSVCLCVYTHILKRIALERFNSGIFATCILNFENLINNTFLNATLSSQRPLYTLITGKASSQLKNLLVISYSPILMLRLMVDVMVLNVCT